MRPLSAGSCRRSLSGVGFLLGRGASSLCRTQECHHVPLFLLIALIAVSAAAVPARRAAAQTTGLSTNPQSRSTVGGYTGQTLQNLYRSDIGTGYSAPIAQPAKSSRIRWPAFRKLGSKRSTPQRPRSVQASATAR